ncbi:MAG: hypothetical protein FWD99_03060 [Oscillospiraceae bacterium]|nr:hypothetical protein [Oscillospiraceae bacterium]
MLGRLMKYEFLATGRQILPAYIGVILFAVLNRILIEIGGGMDTFWLDPRWEWMVIVVGFLIFFYIMAIAAALVITIVLIIRRFYTNLFKDEGYLTNTLPVSVDVHIWGKLIPAACWMIASVIVVIVSVIILLGGVIADYWPTEWPFELVWTSTATLAALLWLLSSTVGLLAGILAYYSALSIGQLAKRYKILLAIVVYYGINYAFAIIFVIAIFGVVIFSPEAWLEPEAFNVLSIYAMVLGASLLQGAVHYFITRYILKNKLNLE